MDFQIFLVQLPSYEIIHASKDCCWPRHTWQSLLKCKALGCRRCWTVFLSKIPWTTCFLFFSLPFVARNMETSPLYYIRILLTHHPLFIQWMTFIMVWRVIFPQTNFITANGKDDLSLAHLWSCHFETLISFGCCECPEVFAIHNTTVHHNHRYHIGKNHLKKCYSLLSCFFPNSSSVFIMLLLCSLNI